MTKMPTRIASRPRPQARPRRTAEPITIEALREQLRETHAAIDRTLAVIHTTIEQSRATRAKTEIGTAA